MTGLLKLLTGVLEKFNSRDYNTQIALLSYLDESIKIYNDLGRIQRESELQLLKAEIITAQRGISPITFEKKTINRHEMENTISFKVLQSSEQQLRSDILENENTLKQAKDLVSQIIVASIQLDLLNTDKINAIKTSKDIDDLWVNIGADANINLGQKRVLLIVSKYDALLLFEDLLSSIKS